MRTAESVRRPRRWFVVVLLVMLVATIGAGPSGAVAAQTGADPTSERGLLQSSTETTNVELILDASGSMAETVTDGDSESRMDAARRAMRDVIEQIPERDGLNVGFRVYGHEGNNQESGKAESCRSSDLLVPLRGVDKERLLEQVESFQPTGWTPLAFALEQAAGDFAPGGESVTNAVIMVTDGEETCGGDPCAVAAALRANEISVVTHVVGFALTDEQREAVRCIADEGGGELFSADNAEELSEAVFSAIEQVEATPAPTEQALELELEVGGYVGGNAFALLPECEADALSVIAVGPYEDGRGLPVVVCNRTGGDVADVVVAATAREADGGLIGEGETLGLVPSVVVDGGLAFGRVYFGADDLPDDATFDDFELASAPVEDDETAIRFDFVVEELNVRENEIAGRLRNEHEIPVSVAAGQIACFDDAGALLAIVETIPGGTVEPGDNLDVAFDVESPGFGDIAGPCPVFLLGGGGVRGL